MPLTPEQLAQLKKWEGELLPQIISDQDLEGAMRVRRTSIVDDPIENQIERCLKVAHEIPALSKEIGGWEDRAELPSDENKASNFEDDDTSVSISSSETQSDKLLHEIYNAIAVAKKNEPAKPSAVVKSDVELDAIVKKFLGNLGTTQQDNLDDKTLKNLKHFFAQYIKSNQDLEKNIHTIPFGVKSRLVEGTKLHRTLSVFNGVFFTDAEIINAAADALGVKVDPALLASLQTTTAPTTTPTPTDTSTTTATTTTTAATTTPNVTHPTPAYTDAQRRLAKAQAFMDALSNIQGIDQEDLRMIEDSVNKKELGKALDLIKDEKILAPNTSITVISAIKAALLYNNKNSDADLNITNDQLRSVAKSLFTAKEGSNEPSNENNNNNPSISSLKG